jgi:hypothetical protein
MFGEQAPSGGGMASAYLFVAGINYDAAVFDTQDLSTIRGSGLALLRAPEMVERKLADWLGVEKVERIRTGASEGLFRVACDRPEWLRCKLERWLARDMHCPAEDSPDDRVAPPFHHLTFAVGIAAGGEAEFATSSTAAIADARVRQLQSLTLRLPALLREDGGPATLPCEEHRVLPATVQRSLKGERDETGAFVKRDLSESFYHRHRFGRGLRQRFYEKELGLPPLPHGFTDSFEEIVDLAAAPRRRARPRETLDPALAAALPVAVEQKMAVLFFDGNGFGELFALARGEMATRELSDALTACRRRLLKGLLDAFADEANRPWAKAMWRADPKDGARQLRFETLLWGGEEMLFVCPGWAALEVMAVIQEQLDDESKWTVKVAGEDKVVSHAGGMVICHHKTPIRLVKQLAEWKVGAAAKSALKPAGSGGLAAERKPYRNGFQLMVLEGIDVPTESLEHWRERVLTAPPGETAQAPLCIFDGARWPTTLQELKTRKGRLVRSQAYRLLDRAMRARRAGQTLDDAWWEASEPEKLFARGHRPSGIGSAALAEATMGLPGAGGLHGLQQLVALWDYLDPFALEAGS